MRISQAIQYLSKSSIIKNFKFLYSVISIFIFALSVSCSDKKYPDNNISTWDISELNEPESEKNNSKGNKYILFDLNAKNSSPKDIFTSTSKKILSNKYNLKAYNLLDINLFFMKTEELYISDLSITGQKKIIDFVLELIGKTCISQLKECSSISDFRKNYYFAKLLNSISLNNTELSLSNRMSLLVLAKEASSNKIFDFILPTAITLHPIDKEKLKTIPTNILSGWEYLFKLSLVKTDIINNVKVKNIILSMAFTDIISGELNENIIESIKIVEKLDLKSHFLNPEIIFNNYFKNSDLQKQLSLLISTNSKFIDFFEIPDKEDLFKSEISLWLLLYEKNVVSFDQLSEIFIELFPGQDDVITKRASDFFNIYFAHRTISTFIKMKELIILHPPINLEALNNITKKMFDYDIHWDSLITKSKEKYNFLNRLPLKKTALLKNLLSKLDNIDASIRLFASIPTTLIMGYYITQEQLNINFQLSADTTIIINADDYVDKVISGDIRPYFGFGIGRNEKISYNEVIKGHYYAEVLDLFNYFDLRDESNTTSNNDNSTINYVNLFFPEVLKKELNDADKAIKSIDNYLGTHKNISISDKKCSEPGACNKWEPSHFNNFFLQCSKLSDHYCNSYGGDDPICKADQLLNYHKDKPVPLIIKKFEYSFIYSFIGRPDAMSYDVDSITDEAKESINRVDEIYEFDRQFISEYFYDAYKFYYLPDGDQISYGTGNHLYRFIERISLDIGNRYKTIRHIFDALNAANSNIKPELDLFLDTTINPSVDELKTYVKKLHNIEMPLGLCSNFLIEHENISRFELAKNLASRSGNVYKIISSTQTTADKNRLLELYFLDSISNEQKCTYHSNLVELTDCLENKNNEAVAKSNTFDSIKENPWLRNRIFKNVNKDSTFSSARLHSDIFYTDENAMFHFTNYGLFVQIMAEIINGIKVDPVPSLEEHKERAGDAKPNLLIPAGFVKYIIPNENIETKSISGYKFASKDLLIDSQISNSTNTEDDFKNAYLSKLFDGTFAILEWLRNDHQVLSHGMFNLRSDSRVRHHTSIYRIGNQFDSMGTSEDFCLQDFLSDKEEPEDDNNKCWNKHPSKLFDTIFTHYKQISVYQEYFDVYKQASLETSYYQKINGLILHFNTEKESLIAGTNDTNQRSFGITETKKEHFDYAFSLIQDFAMTNSKPTITHDYWEDEYKYIPDMSPDLWGGEKSEKIRNFIPLIAWDNVYNCKTRKPTLGNQMPLDSFLKELFRNDFLNYWSQADLFIEEGNKLYDKDVAEDSIKNYRPEVDSDHSLSNLSQGYLSQNLIDKLDETKKNFFEKYTHKYYIEDLSCEQLNQ